MLVIRNREMKEKLNVSLVRNGINYLFKVYEHTWISYFFISLFICLSLLFKMRSGYYELLDKSKWKRDTNEGFVNKSASCKDDVTCMSFTILA